MKVTTELSHLSPPVGVMDIELGRPLSSLPAASPPGQATVVLALIRLHTHPIGTVLLAVGPDGLSSAALGRMIWDRLGGAIAAHLDDDGLDGVGGLGAQGIPPDGAPSCLRRRAAVLADAPLISVVVATRDRTASLACCLDSLLSMKYPRFEIVVVDNAPATDETAKLIATAFVGRPVRYVREDRPGLAAAHNRGVEIATGAILAFTDDDVVVDRHWLAAIAEGFTLAHGVAAVTGLIQPAELQSSAQVLLEGHGSYAKGFRPRVFDLADHRPPNPLFPLSAGLFGSGANMAFEASCLRRLGGFDPALGAGTVARGGDDLDAFFRVVMGGHRLVYQPAALVRHRHRPDRQALASQAYGYGVGLGAYLAGALIRHPWEVMATAGRAPGSLITAISLTSARNRRRFAGWPAELARRERRGMIVGPFAYAASRRRSQRARRPPTPMITAGPPAPVPGGGSSPVPRAGWGCAAAPGAGGDDLLVTDLLNDFATLTELLVGEIDRCHWLDSYLLAAGATQILEDSTGGTGWSWRAVIDLAGRPSGPVRASGRVGRTVLSVVRSARSLGPSGRRIAKAHAALSDLTNRLAQAVVAPAPVGTSEGCPGNGKLAGEARRARELGWAVPVSVQRTVLRLPSCFRSFDQQPDDLRSLADRFAAVWPDRDIPIVVAGVRTSGSYLAPLAAAAMRTTGYHSVGAVTLRPGVPPVPSARARLRGCVAAGGVVALIDDPPDSGTALSTAAATLVDLGVPADRIVLLLAVADAQGEVPLPLRRFRRVVLAWPDWRVHRQLTEESTSARLTEMLAPSLQVLGVVARATPDRPCRDHARGIYAVTVANRQTGRRQQLDVAVEGAGLGYLGRHTVALSQALAGSVPEVYGFSDGLLYRRWLPDATRRNLAEPETTAAVARYVTARRQALAVSCDRSTELAGQQPVWEVAAAIVAKTAGPLASVLRPAVGRAVRKTLHVERPAVVDGRMTGANWFGSDDGPGLYKVAWAEGAFSHKDLSCYDPVWDLAGAATAARDASALRRSFAANGEPPIDEGRWLLYTLVHQWNAVRLGQTDDDEAGRAAASAVARFWAARYLDDLDGQPAGPFCALDIDGVLETDPLGFPGTTLAGAMALRALRVHGYQAVLASGRSVDEVRDRCRAYRLAGGVAEYGSVLYDGVVDRVVPLASPVTADAAAGLRARLDGYRGLELDPAYQFAVRVYRRDDRGRRRGVPSSLLKTVIPAGWQLVAGDRQTDLVPPSIDKGLGLRALLAQIGDRQRAGVATPLRLAVGDSEADLPMLTLAELPLAPANAAAAVRRNGITVVPSGYQAGLAVAVGRLIGHRLGGCPVCRPPKGDDSTELLSRLLSIREAGVRSLPLRLACTGLAAWRRS